MVFKAFFNSLQNSNMVCFHFHSVQKALLCFLFLLFSLYNFYCYVFYLTSFLLHCLGCSYSHLHIFNLGYSYFHFWKFSPFYPTCHGATKSMLHKYWAHVLQLLKPILCNEEPLQWEACVLQLESSALLLQVEKNPHSNK